MFIIRRWRQEEFAGSNLLGMEGRRRGRKRVLREWGFVVEPDIFAAHPVTIGHDVSKELTKCCFAIWLSFSFCPGPFVD
jgi:hypothetical protein